jgi:hypothetical protein
MKTDLEQQDYIKYGNVSKKCRERGGRAAVPRGNKPAEWPPAGSETEA